MEKQNKMRLSIKAYGQRYSVSIAEDSDIYQVASVLRGLLCAVGFADSVVDDVINDCPISDAEELCECDTEKCPVTKKTESVFITYDL